MGSTVAGAQSFTPKSTGKREGRVHGLYIAGSQ